jgi:hypothetical protein
LASRFLASRQPEAPRAASGPRGGAGVARLNGSPGLVLLLPLLLLLRRAVVWTRDESPEAARVGNSGRSGGSLLIAAGGAGCVDGADA